MRYRASSSSAIWPYIALVLCFSSAALTFGIAPGLRVPLLFLGFSFLTLLNFKKQSQSYEKNLHLFAGAFFYLFFFIAYGFFREQNTTDFFNVIFTGIAAGFFINGVMWASPRKSFSQNEIKYFFNKIGSYLLLPLVLILLLSTNEYSNYLKYSINLMGGGRELSLDTGNPVGVAYANGIASIVFLFITLNVKGLIFKGASFLGMLLSLFIVISTASRGASLFLILTSLLYFIVYIRMLQRENNLQKVAKRIFIGGVAILVFFSIYFFLQRENFLVLFDRVSVLFSRFSDAFNYLEGLNDDRSTGGRFEVYKYHLNYFSEWIIFGEKNYTPYPHNLFLEIIMRLGLIGLPLVFVFIYINLKTFLNLFNKSFYKTVDWYFFSFLFFFSFLQSMTSLSLEINRGIWISLGFLLAYNPLRHRQNLR
ncbi:MAG: hypothetical protein CML08_02275 [Puniceicoccaceae bacterium]|nr:hypothetical protein [Puniceicoccaceae bacterium]|tara:strand:- start:9712 stop:10980 length:1269 start_codon:yes stop_codon:yes gene_type:complete